MKRTVCLLIAFSLVIPFISTSQKNSVNQVNPYVGQAGIKKKVSDLQAVKPKERKLLNSNSIAPLKFRLKNFPNSVKTDHEGHVIGVSEFGDEDEEGRKKGLKATTSPTVTSKSQEVASNFLSIDFYDNIIGWPPDPNGAVGATLVVVATNMGIKVFDKPAVTDLPIVTPLGYSREEARATLFLTLDQFFSPISLPNSFIGDIHIRYDRLSRRWFIVADDFSNNLALLAVSDGDKITGTSTFTYFSFNAILFPYDEDGPVPFFDYPMLGVDKHSVLIGANLFGRDSITFAGYVIDKQQLLKGKLVVTPFELGNYNLLDGTAWGAIVPQGVYNDDPEAKKSFFVGTGINNDGLVIANIDYDQKNKPHLKFETNVEVSKWGYPKEVSALGNQTPIDPLDTRLFAAAIYKNKLTGNSSLWTAHAIGVNKAGNFINGSDSDFVRETRNASRWYKIGNIYSKPKIFQSGTIYDAEQGSGRRAKQYFNPSIAASGQGHSIVSGTTSAFDEYLNVFAAGRYFGDALGSSKSPEKLTHTTAIYAPSFIYQGTRYYVGRWGDYSQTVVDPLDDQTIWTFQEYANVDDSYGVRVVQFKAPPPATPAPIGTLSNKTDTTITLQGESIDNSGFFDPGKDEGGPGYNRLSIKSTGSIIVSNIKFISPTKISFKLNTKNKPAGHYTLIITNPDGQLEVTDFTLSGNTSTLITNNNLQAERHLRSQVARSFITEAQIFPNPTTKTATLQLNAAKDYEARIVLVDVNGKTVYERNYSFLKGSNQATLPTERLTKGTYIAVVYTKDNILITSKRIIKQ